MRAMSRTPPLRTTAAVLVSWLACAASAGAALQGGPPGPDGGIERARALRQRALHFPAFFQYARIVESGPAHPDYLEAVAGAAAAGEELGDQVFAPNILRKVDAASIARLPAGARARIDYAVALLAYRGGDLEEAARRLEGVGPESPVSARARLLQGLLAQPKEPEKAAAIFRGLLQLRDPGRGRDLGALQELAHLDLGRTLYGLHRYAEASREYGALPRFSRHWDEALFEGAYADLKAGDKGGALGRLHGLHSPHLSDEFAPESELLAAIVYGENCLHPQVREALKRFRARYLPMRDQLDALLAAGPPLPSWVALLHGAPGLPSPVERHLRKNERIDALLGYLGRLEAEAARVEALADLPPGVSRAALREIVEDQRALAAQVAGKLIRGRIADLAHLIDVLEREQEIVAFENAKGEKALLEENVDVSGALARQQLSRPGMPTTGHEYWPFDGEYWPDEIGFYRYTLKDACPATAKDDAP
ncbi:MAG: hypothetical protein NVSMB23_00500 [Myxococcales bacterium]